MISGIDSFPLLAVPFFILAGNLMNNAGITNRIYNFALGLVGWMKGGLGHVNIVGSRHLRRHVRHRDRRRRRPRHDRDQGDARPWLQQGVRRGRDGGLGDARSDHPAVAAVRDLRDGRQRRRSAQLFLAGIIPGPRDDGRDDADRRVLRAQEQLGRRHQVRMAARGQGRSSSSPIVIAWPFPIWRS